MTMEDLQVEGKAEQLGRVMTAVAFDTAKAKGFRLPTDDERSIALQLGEEVKRTFSQIPFGVPVEQIVEDAKRNTWCVQYGIDRFNKLFTDRQLIGMGTLVNKVREVH